MQKINKRVGALGAKRVQVTKNYGTRNTKGKLGYMWTAPGYAHEDEKGEEWVHVMLDTNMHLYPSKKYFPVNYTAEEFGRLWLMPKKDLEEVSFKEADQAKCKEPRSQYSYSSL